MTVSNPSDAPPPMKTQRGLYGKFRVERTDGQSAEGEKHDRCEYFVLDLTHDEHAVPAILAYIESCRAEYPALASDLKRQIGGIILGRCGAFPGDPRGEPRV